MKPMNTTAKRAPAYVCARLTTGQIVPLRKDCECITHTGPHWLNATEDRRASNRELLDRAQRSANAGNNMDATLALHGLANEEIARLRELAFQFRKHGIAQLLTPADVDAIRAAGEAVDVSRPGLKPHLRAAIRLCYNDARREFAGGRTWTAYLALWEWCGFRDGGIAGDKQERFYAKHGRAAYYARINRVRAACGFEPVNVPS
jgi:hypothetical protein